MVKWNIKASERCHILSMTTSSKDFWGLLLVSSRVSSDQGALHFLSFFFIWLEETRSNHHLFACFMWTNNCWPAFVKKKPWLGSKLHMDQYFPVWTQKLHNSLNLSLLHSATYFYCIVSNCHICCWKGFCPILYCQ